MTEEKLTPFEQAESALETFKRSMEEGHPWVPGSLFISNPGLDLYILAALQGFLHAKQVAEQVKPARRVSLSENPNWRPSSVAPVLPGSKEWVVVKDDDNGKDAG